MCDLRVMQLQKGKTGDFLMFLTLVSMSACVGCAESSRSSVGSPGTRAFYIARCATDDVRSIPHASLKKATLRGALAIHVTFMLSL